MWPRVSVCSEESPVPPFLCVPLVAIYGASRNKYQLPTLFFSLSPVFPVQVKAGHKVLLNWPGDHILNHLSLSLSVCVCSCVLFTNENKFFFGQAPNEVAVERWVYIETMYLFVSTATKNFAGGTIEHGIAHVQHRKKARSPNGNLFACLVEFIAGLRQQPSLDNNSNSNTYILDHCCRVSYRLCWSDTSVPTIKPKPTSLVGARP